uniref:NADH-ubiquinone oxidoreductase chain 6 n=1 Tax=Tropisternus sp. BYU-CO166 TaxID=696091 RepID=D8WKI2_9COLE|nr:NADH dehydrogenase subunit 6 [Tropisternus sp. BYU-CO166]ACZ58515.1 NADH dehydrogenase subunit 6 [Tropisternus sp. BYU-CO166]
MTFLIMMTTLTLSISITMVNHPLSMGLILLMQVICVSLTTSLMSSNFWFSYVLFLIMIGGMLVLFAYMTSIASNEKFNYSNKLIIMLAMIMIPTIIATMIGDWTIMDYQNFNLEKIDNFQFDLTLTKMMNFPQNMLLLAMILYLFIALIAVVKISNVKFGPLRQTN